jgi:hypothetical protein
MNNDNPRIKGHYLFHNILIQKLKNFLKIFFNFFSLPAAHGQVFEIGPSRCKAASHIVQSLLLELLHYKQLKWQSPHEGTLAS